MSTKFSCLLLFAVALTGKAFSECPVTGDLTGRSESFSVGLVTLPDQVQVGEIFSLQLTACHLDGTPFIGTIKPSAVMPAHRHGMNYQPTVQWLAAGEYQLNGYLFHMPGHWQFQFRMSSGDRYETLTIDYPL